MAQSEGAAAGGALADDNALGITYALLGDANLNGMPNGIDFNLLPTNFDPGVTGGWDGGDFNYDGEVNALNFNLLAENFDQLASQSGDSSADIAALDAFAAANGISLASVPEPASASVLAIGALGILRRRRRQTLAYTTAYPSIQI